eukprot:2790128-Lingulodinium_polyedra.AAC.1
MKERSQFQRLPISCRAGPSGLYGPAVRIDHGERHRRKCHPAHVWQNVGQYLQAPVRRGGRAVA